MSNCLQPRGLRHARFPCPSPSPRSCSNSCPLSWTCPTISCPLSWTSQPSHPLSPTSPALNLSKHQDIFQWVSSSHQVANSEIISHYYMLGEPTYVVKEFTEVWTSKEMRVFIQFPREGRGQMHRVVLTPKCKGLSLLLSFKGQDRASLVAQLVKNLLAMWETWVQKIPWRRECLPTQYSGLENSMDCIVHEVTKNWAGLTNFHFQRARHRKEGMSSLFDAQSYLGWLCFCRVWGFCE